MTSSRPLTVVTVTYSPGSHLDRFLSSLTVATDRPLTVVMADNGSIDGAPEEALERYPGTELLRTGGNLGYGSAVNRAVAKLPADDEFVIVANPDVVWSPGSIDALLDAAERWPRAATLGPLIRDPDGSVYPSARHLPSLVRGGMHAVVGFAWKRNPWTKAYRQEYLEPSERPVGWLSGSCLLVRRAAFDAGRRVRRALLHVHGGRRPRRPARPGRLAQRLRPVGGDPARQGPLDRPRSGPQPARPSRQHLHLPVRSSFRMVAGAAAVDDEGRAQGAVARSGTQVQAGVGERVGGSVSDVDPAGVDAVILVGGKGTRLRPLTLSAPKPMLPTAGVPFLTHLLSRIADAGIEHVILGTSYKAATFENEFGDGSKLGLQIDYVTEEHPLGTGGGIANVVPKLRNDTVMVFNGDVLSGMDLRQMLAAHHEQRSRPDPAPGPGERPAGVRVRAHRRRRPCAGVPGEDRRPADRPDQRRYLHLQAGDHRPDSARARGVGRA